MFLLYRHHEIISQWALQTVLWVHSNSRRLPKWGTVACTARALTAAGNRAGKAPVLRHGNIGCGTGCGWNLAKEQLPRLHLRFRASKSKSCRDGQLHASGQDRRQLVWETRPHRALSVKAECWGLLALHPARLGPGGESRWTAEHFVCFGMRDGSKYNAREWLFGSSSSRKKEKSRPPKLPQHIGRQTAEPVEQ